MKRTAWLLAPVVLAAVAEAAPRAGIEETFEIAEQSLKLDFALLPGFEKTETTPNSGGGQMKHLWRGKIGASDVQIEYWVLPRDKYWFGEPSDVVSLVESDRSSRPSDGVPFAFQESFPVTGGYGFVPYGWVGFHTKFKDTKPVENVVALGGLLREQAYSFEITCRPALLADGKETLFKFLREGVRYSGEALNPEWEDEELNTRWVDSAPDRVLKQDELGVIRTKHYVILTNMRAKGGTAKKFGKKMEECYETIRKMYPFEDIEGERLLPVFLFKTDEQYHEFLVKTLGQTMEQAKKSAGIAYKDFYATSYAAPNDPVHIHEATHQIFKNRLRLGGGGSWFQEGVAEYVSTEKNDRKVFRNRVKKGTQTPLREFMELKSLLYSAKVDQRTGSESGGNYRQAACVIEFVRESKWGKAKFQEFIHAVGKVPRSNLEAIEEAIQSVYGVGIDGFEEEFLKYWRKR